LLQKTGKIGEYDQTIKDWNIRIKT
jgi:hypothetical protein